MASLGVWCTLRKQRIWFDSRRVGAEGRHYAAPQYIGNMLKLSD